MTKINWFADADHAFRGFAQILLKRQSKAKTMKTKTIKSILLITSYFACIGGSHSHATYDLKQTKMSVSGTSSHHDCVSEGGNVEWAGTIQVNGSQ
jgi:hypothetical protein